MYQLYVLGIGIIASNQRIPDMSYHSHTAAAVQRDPTVEVSSENPKGPGTRSRKWICRDLDLETLHRGHTATSLAFSPAASVPGGGVRRGRKKNTKQLPCGTFRECVESMMASVIWVFPKIGVPKNGWFMMENPVKMDDLETPIWIWKNLMISSGMRDCHLELWSGAQW